MSIGVIVEPNTELHEPPIEEYKYYFNNTTGLILLVVDATYNHTGRVQGIIMNAGKTFGRLTTEEGKLLKPWYGTITITSQP